VLLECPRSGVLKVVGQAPGWLSAFVVPLIRANVIKMISTCDNRPIKAAGTGPAIQPSRHFLRRVSPKLYSVPEPARGTRLRSKSRAATADEQTEVEDEVADTGFDDTDNWWDSQLHGDDVDPMLIDSSLDAYSATGAVSHHSSPAKRQRLKPQDDDAAVMPHPMTTAEQSGLIPNRPAIRNPHAAVQSQYELYCCFAEGSAFTVSALLQVQENMQSFETPMLI